MSCPCCHMATALLYRTCSFQLRDSHEKYEDAWYDRGAPNIVWGIILPMVKELYTHTTAPKT